jgi:hypothetical protein
MCCKSKQTNSQYCAVMLQQQLTAALVRAVLAAACAHRYSRRLHDHALKPLLRRQLNVAAANGLHLCQQGNSSTHS